MIVTHSLSWFDMCNVFVLNAYDEQQAHIAAVKTDSYRRCLSITAVISKAFSDLCAERSKIGFRRGWSKFTLDSVDFA